MIDRHEMAVRALPSALSHWREIAGLFAHKRPVVLLDYDGTLTPIVDRPDLALIDDETRATVRSLADSLPVAVVSGRAAADVRDLVGLANIVYCGSHGFEVIGLDGRKQDHAAGRAFLPALEAAERDLQAALARIDGLIIERKRFSVAVHHRLVAEPKVATVLEAVDCAAAAHPELRKMAGKKVLELRPDLAWDKGRAIIWLLEILGLDPRDVAALYLGDDITDEDAFRALLEHDIGVGIVVGERPGPTAAQYRLADPGDVRKFLRLITQHVGRRR